MASTPDASEPKTARNAARLIVPLFIGAGVSVALGVYGRVHTPTGVIVNITGFSSGESVKTWLATFATFFALVQVTSALVMNGKIPGIANPTWISAVHRWSGRAAFFLAVPVAVNCLYALGFQWYSPRVLIHSLLGCIFFGAFTVKMIALTKPRLANWVVALLGGIVFTLIVALWLTSALWFFSKYGVTI